LGSKRIKYQDDREKWMAVKRAMLHIMHRRRGDRKPRLSLSFTQSRTRVYYRSRQLLRHSPVVSFSFFNPPSLFLHYSTYNQFHLLNPMAMSFPFLNLPAALRNKIYTHIISASSFPIPTTTTFRAPTAHDLTPYRGLILSCHQLATEFTTAWAPIFNIYLHTLLPIEHFTFPPITEICDTTNLCIGLVRPHDGFAQYHNHPDVDAIFTKLARGLLSFVIYPITPIVRETLPLAPYVVAKMKNGKWDKHQSDFLHEMQVIAVGVLRSTCKDSSAPEVLVGEDYLKIEMHFGWRDVVAKRLYGLDWTRREAGMGVEWRDRVFPLGSVGAWGYGW
jgi:hypothetical protein